MCNSNCSCKTCSMSGSMSSSTRTSTRASTCTRARDTSLRSTVPHAHAAHARPRGTCKALATSLRRRCHLSRITCNFEADRVKRARTAASRFVCRPARPENPRAPTDELDTWSEGNLNPEHPGSDTRKPLRRFRRYSGYPTQRRCTRWRKAYSMYRMPPQSGNPHVGKRIHAGPTPRAVPRSGRSRPDSRSRYFEIAS